MKKPNTRIPEHFPSSSPSNFDLGLSPFINGDARIYPTLTAISPTPTLHLTWFKASSFSKPILLLTLPHLHLPRLFWSSSLPLALHFKLQCFSQSHLTPFAFAIWTTVSFNPNISIRSSASFSPSVLHHTFL